MPVVGIPGSESITARALFLAAAADGVTTLVRPLRSDGTEGFAEGLVRLGYRVGRAPEVDGRPQGPAVEEADVLPGRRDDVPLPADPRGDRPRHVPLRRLAPDAPTPTGPVEQGPARPRRGPEARGGGGPPSADRAGGGRGGGRGDLDAGQSSQYLTALLLLGPLTRKGLRIVVTGLVSAPYAEITIAMMRAFGVEVRREGDASVVPPGGYRATTYAIEPDASTAGYFFAAAAVTGGEVTVPGLGSGALRGDLGFVDVLRRMGAEVSVGPAATTVRGTGRPHGLTVNMRDISDIMPTLAAIAPFASGPVRIEDVANTRVKECDRLKACAEKLRRLAVEVAAGGGRGGCGVGNWQICSSP